MIFKFYATFSSEKETFSQYFENQCQKTLVGMHVTLSKNAGLLNNNLRLKQ